MLLSEHLSSHAFTSQRKICGPYLQKIYFVVRIKKCLNTGCSSNIVFFPRNFNILRPLPRQDRTSIGCTENDQPIRVTKLRSDELIFYMQGLGCSKIGKNTIFNEQPVH